MPDRTHDRRDAPRTTASAARWRAAVTAQNDAHARPRLADLAHDARHLSIGAIAAGNIRHAAAGPAAECRPQNTVERAGSCTRHDQNQEKPAFLSAVQRNVGIVEIEHDLARRTLMRLQEKLDQQRVNLWPATITIDPVILRGMAFGRRRTIERLALAGPCGSSDRSTGCQLAGRTPMLALRSSSCSCRPRSPAPGGDPLATIC